jgi:Na+/H+ antiporter NhaD/arsenite permease-like protein
MTYLNAAGYHMEAAGIVVLGIFIIVLLIILSERVNDTAAALLGFGFAAMVVYFMQGIPFVEFAGTIGWDIILFVASMMIIVSVTASSGLFQYVALILAERTAGNPKRVFIYFLILVYFISLFFDPLPTMLIVSAFTVQVCNAIDVDFRPYLMSEAVVACVASFPSPIGSITNLVIVFLAEINTGIMFLSLLPLSVILFLTTLFYMMKKFEDKLDDTIERDLTDMFAVDPNITIRSRFDLLAACIGMVVLILGIIILPEQSAMVALIVAAALLIPTRDRARDLFRRLSWDSVFFLAGMMGIVQALVTTGVIQDLAGGLQGIAETNEFLAIFAMILIPGGLMAPVDAKAVGILMAPAAKQLTAVNPMIPISLTLGTNAGGYVVPFGDAPNIVVVSVCQENLKPLSWTEFNKTVIPLGILHLVISTIYCAIVSLLF